MSNKTKAVILMLISSLALALSAASVKLAGQLPVFEKVFFRNIISVVVAFIVLKQKKMPAFGKVGNQKFLILRSLFGIVGMVLYFYAISHLVLADSAMLHKLFPFFVTIFAAIFLKEKISRIQIPALFLVFFAALLIIKPRFDYSMLPALAGLGSAIVSGMTYTLVRFLRDREHPSTIVFYFSFASLVVLAPFVALDFQVPTLSQWLYLFMIGIFAAIGQFSLTYAYRYGQASEIAIYSYANIIFAAFIGFILWGEISDKWSTLGGSLIILISIIVFIYNGRNAEK